MSRFFNYSAPNAARIYDKIRTPAGMDIVAGLLHVHCQKPLKEIHLLDAGCGTGQQAKDLLDHGVGKITLLDASTEMLAVAKEKLDDAIKNKKIDLVIRTNLPNLPFQDKTFDAVLLSESLHHLDKLGDGKSFPETDLMLSGTHRILKENGVLLVLTVPSSMIRESNWYFQAHAGIREKLAKVFMPVQQYISFFLKHNFKCVSAVNLLSVAGEHLIHSYYDPESPLNEEWRQATCFFDIATEDEVKEMEAFLLDKKEKGLLEKFMQENDHAKDQGYTTIFLCIAQSKIN